MCYTIYLRTNIVNGMSYVGQTKNIIQRNSRWKSFKHPYANKYIDEDKAEFGLEMFDFKILAECETQKDAWELEQKYIKELNTVYPNGYNISIGGASHNGVAAWNKGLKGVQTAWNKGKKCPQIAGENHPMYGKHHTEETKKKISEAKKGKPLPKGRIVSLETRMKLSEINKGKHHSPNTEFKKGCISPKRKIVYQYNLNGEFICEHNSVSDAAESVNGSEAHISSCCRGKRKTHKGFVWKYE